MLGLESPIKTHHLSIGKDIAIQRRLNKTWVILPGKKGDVRLLGRKPTVLTIAAKEKGVDSKRLRFGDILQTLYIEVKITFH